jgi:arginase
LSAKLIRQPDQLALVGAPTSAGAAGVGVERAPAALRAARIVERLQEVGYQVTDAGDLPEQIFQPDAENPRARNLKGILAELDVLKPRIEQMAKAHAFPVVLGGDATIVLALAAGLRRQAPSLGLVHLGRYADLHTPQRTEDGLVEPMIVSHLVGQGAAEMVRFWKDPPVVREPDVALFGLGALDAIDEQRLTRLAVRRFPLARIRKMGARAAAETVLERLRGEKRDFVVHLSMDVVSREEFPAADRGEPGGMSLAEVAEALNCFAEQEKFAGLSISGYNPALEAEGRCAEIIVDLVVKTMAVRHTALIHPQPEEEEAEAAEAAEATAAGAEAAAAGEEKAETKEAAAVEATPAPQEAEAPAEAAPAPEKEPETPAESPAPAEAEAAAGGEAAAETSTAPEATEKTSEMEAAGDAEAAGAESSQNSPAAAPSEAESGRT